MELYGINIEETESLQKEQIYETLFSAYRLDKIKKCKNEKAKRQSIAAGYLLDYVLRCHGMTEKTAYFSINSYGRPCFVGTDVNLSHSGSYVVAAFDREPVGIDVEKVHPDKVKRNHIKVARRFFASDEYDWLMKQPEQERAFCRLWTLKESYVKYLGTGMATPFTEFCISMEQAPYRADACLMEYQIGDYCIAACSGKNQFPEEICWLKEEELMKKQGKVLAKGGFV